MASSAAVLETTDKPRDPAKRASGVAALTAAFGNRVVMTNHPWRIDGDILGQRFDLPNLRVVNDLAAAAHGLDSLGNKDFVTIQPGKAVTGAPRVLLGVGTGLGVAYVVPSGTDQGRTRATPGPGTGQAPVLVVAGEGGHVGFSPASAEQRDYWLGALTAFGRLSPEAYADDRTLRRLIDLAPFGLSSAPPEHTRQVLKGARR